MDLLVESKRAWLISYFVFLVIAIFLYFFSWDTVIGKTACILVTEMLFLMLIFFLLVISIKLTNWCRTILMISYLGGSIYLGINHYISKWYIIVPLSILLIFYMLWIMGGVKNCIIANKYKNKIDKEVYECKNLYDSYTFDVELYNKRNELGFLTKVRLKDPKLCKYEFKSSGLDMFILGDALRGIETAQWEDKIQKLEKFKSVYNDKDKALRNNESLYKEKYTINRIKEKTESFGGETEGFDKQIKAIDTEIGNSRKREKKILKKRW